MPRAFSEPERTKIRSNLLEAGRQYLISTGMTKTSVEMLARKAHISKGAFYQFFASKEALFITILEEAEQAFHQQLRQQAQQRARSPQEQLSIFFTSALKMYRSNPLLSQFNQTDMDTLMRGATPAQLQRENSKDVAFFQEIIALWQGHGHYVNCSAKQLTGLLHALGLIALYADDFQTIFESVPELMIEALADKLA